MIDLNKIYNSDQYKTAHSKAKKMLKTELDSLNSKNLIEDSDIISIYLLIDDLNTFYNITDCISTNYTAVNAKGLTISNPLLKEKSSAGNQAIKILTELGGTTKSKRTINRKDMQAADDSNSAIDNLINNNDSDQGADDF